MSDGSRSRLPGNERLLQAAWRRLARGASVSGSVPGRDGVSYTILYPGRPADGPGPDFRDAVLQGPDGTVLRGDVEIHVRASGWRAHGHHSDPRYNGVAFHVTGWPPSGREGEPGAVRTASGRPIHLLVLGSSEGQKATKHSARPERMELLDFLRKGMPQINPALPAAGDQRFLGKSAGLSISLRTQGGDAAAWAAVLDCLGYSRNRAAFRGVANRLPWPVLSKAVDAGGDTLSLLMWAGGFGPKPRGLTGVLDPVSRAPAPAWAPGGRPDNRPERRLAAAAALAQRWRAGGPLGNMISAVRTATGPKEIIESFRVGAGPSEGKQMGGRALIGFGRAGEIVVNAALPLVHGWSLLADRWDVTEKALRLYRDHPKLPGNAVTREMTALLASPEIRGAREQQGLMLMYRAMTAGPAFAGPAVAGFPFTGPVRDA